MFIKKCLALLNFFRKSNGLALRDTNFLRDLGPSAGFILKELVGFTQLTMITLDGLRGSDFKLILSFLTHRASPLAHRSVSIDAPR